MAICMNPECVTPFCPGCDPDMTLIERVAREMATDDADTEDQSERLIDAYMHADAAGRELVDTIFTCLCGWKLSTLLERKDNEDSDND